MITNATLRKLRHLAIKFLWLQECVRRGKVVVSKVRGEVNPADVLPKPKSLEDMRSLLNFACIDWCDSSRPQILFIVAIESNMRETVF